MKLDATMLRYLSREDFRVLTAIEIGMRNHQLVPTPLIITIAKLKRGGGQRAIRELHKHKLVYHEAKIYDGYRITYSGYDYLALKAMSSRGSVSAVGNQVRGCALVFVLC
eukprot:TRINITY_DN540_c2_g1_i2.p2 TRINITY_DN540_c2_g1~~TRINITY_DN540_c2_g1_i2.p2  ORF type:complete len:126 (+),score=14.22 TRINITY_DN540_c2_g1_i2:50-379(+)